MRKKRLHYPDFNKKLLETFVCMPELFIRYTKEEVINLVCKEITKTNKKLKIKNGLTDQDHITIGIIMSALR